MSDLRHSALGDFAHEIATEKYIAASPATVWQTLTDFASYPRWNPFILAIEGAASVGNRLLVSIQPPGGTVMRITPVVQTVQASSELTWRGRFIAPGIFTGTHSFSLNPEEDGAATRFIHQEMFTGILVPFFKRSLAEGTRQGFEVMNDALEAEVLRRLGK